MGPKEQTTAGSSRRDFLKFGSLVTAGLPALASCDTGKQATASPPSGNDGEFWNSMRSRFALDPAVTYLNTGTEGAMSHDVLQALNEYLLQFATSPMEAAFYSEDLGYVQQSNRERAATFVKAEPGEVVFTANTTQGMNMVVHGLKLEAGDEVVTTFHEHFAEVSPLFVIRDRYGVVVKQLVLPSPAPSKEAIVELFRDAITPKTKVFVFCHVNYTTGLRMPVKELCDLAREHDIITVVDGAHSLGMIDVGLDQLGCDFYPCACHKWLNGPPGTGLLYVRDGEQNPHRLWPMLTEAYVFPVPLTIMLQVKGQENTPAFKAVGDAMNFHDEIGMAKLEARILELNRYLKTRIVETWGEASLLTPLSDELSSGMASFIPFSNHADRYDEPKFLALVQSLRETQRIYIRTVNFKDREADEQNTNVLRVSTHLFNSFDDVDKLIDALHGIR